MIDLKNIKKSGNVISAHVIISKTHPEEFDITVDIKEQTIINCTRDITDTFVAHALVKLLKLDEESNGNLPKQAQAVWY